MSCNCNRQLNNGVGANNQNRIGKCACGSRCGCGSYFNNNSCCALNNGTISAGTAGYNGNCTNMLYNNNVSGVGGVSIATSYVLPQCYSQSYTPEESLTRGTCFPELDIDY